MRLTERWIRNLSPPPAGKKYFADDQATGLYLMVSVTGLRSFVFRYSTSDGRRRKHHIGRWPEWNATMAREEVASLRRKLAFGTDPQAERRAERSAAADTTFSSTHPV